MNGKTNPNPKIREKGQSLAEFAISITFVIILLAGIVDLGHAFFTFVQLRDAAQEGALYGSVNPTDISGIRTRVRSASETPVDLTDTSIIPDGSIAVSHGAGDVCEGNQISVSITYNYPISMPFIGGIIGTNQIPITATVTDVILQPPCS